MRHATGWGLAVIGAFAVGCGIAIDIGAYATAIVCGLVSASIVYVGPEAWQ